ncbi:unnamed protein product [Citrullus colocynthis]|uniref:Uncharacterized protein n=1 Tax=Citrullus colocynthis TaxID=252529 RepID=A0ABP0YLG5_9ROSI
MNSLASAPFQQVFRNRAIAKATIAKELGISAKSKVNKHANEDYIRYAHMLAQHPPPDSLSDVAVQAHMPMVPRPNPFSVKSQPLHETTGLRRSE